MNARATAVRTTLALCIFLVVWGAKLAVVDRFATDIPYWDQWAKEGELTLAPYLERRELWRPLFLPHNEHRIAPTLALNLGLVVASGQWDARVQCAVNAAIHAALVAGVGWWGLRRLPRRWAIASAALIAFTFAAPIPWENLLGGFQSQFHFLAGFSLLAIGLLPGAAAFSAGWWVGLAAGLGALVSMGSGLLGAFPIILLSGFRLLRSDLPRRDVLATLGAGLALVAAGVWLRPAAPWHAPLQAQTVSGFFTYAARCLAWPLPQFPWLAALYWLPWSALLVRRLREFRRGDSAAADFLLAGGAWVLLQVVAVAYSRAGASAMPSSRYGDIFALGLPLNFCALALLASPSPSLPALPSRTPFLRPLPALGVGYFIVATLGLALSGRAVWTQDLPTRQAEFAAVGPVLRDFVHTDDYAAFEKGPLPFPIAEWLARILRRPSLRSILPASMRPPLHVPGLASAPSFAPALPHRATRMLTAPGEWSSAPLPTGRGWWIIETFGDFGAPGATLAVVSLVDGRTLAVIAPTKPSRDTWRAAYVPVPTEPARLVARLAAPGQRIAFSDPVELSTLSYRTFVFAKYGGWLTSISALVGAGMGLLLVRRPHG